jgi:NADH-quinone oxidoreductase subunit H
VVAGWGGVKGRLGVGDHRAGPRRACYDGIVNITPQFFVSAHVALIVMQTILLAVAYCIWWERKSAAYIQDRIGPNRAGPFGLLQPIADGVKFLLKEDYTPRNVDRVLFTLAPCFIFIPSMLGWAIIPWGGEWAMPELNLPLIGTLEAGTVTVAAADINIGIVYFLAVASVGVYGTVLGGWASNNKYSFLGGLRATAQMISYEIPMGLSLLAVLLVIGSVRPTAIVESQTEGWLGWLIFHQPIAAALFYICMLAEANRAPFDLVEAEQELVGGYHTEYSSMRFALFFLAEYAHLIAGSAFFALVFLGGWQALPIPGLMTGEGGVLMVLARIGVFAGKIAALITLAMVIRWTLPRFRFDQLMRLAWQSMIPVSLALLVLTAVFLRLGWTQWMLVGNIGLAVLIMVIQPMLPKVNVNEKLPMRGSRFSPVKDETAADLGLSGGMSRVDAAARG